MRYKNKLWIVNTILFSILFAFLFIHVSYLFRPYSVNRVNIVGYYSEPEDTIDVVFIGGSSTYVFWAPYIAWNEWGMSSYNFATDSMSPALLMGMIEEARKTQDPELFVIDLRALEVRETHPYFYTDAYLRNITDSLKYSFNRIKTTNYAFSYEQNGSQYNLENYLDLMMYHATWQNLNLLNFDYVSNKMEHPLKGFRMVDFAYHESFEMKDYSDITEKSTLSDSTNQILIDLLEYCNKNNLNVLFTLNSFYQENDDVKKIYNYVAEVVESYGYDFLNTNDYYEEMEIDFSHDFYNRDHVNLYGAEKYTTFLGRYIVQNYAIPDHRQETEYISWHEGYEAWCEQSIYQKQVIDDAIANENQ